MPTSSEQIADLIAAYTDLKAYFEGVRDGIEASVDALQAALTDVIYVDAVAGVDGPGATGLAPLAPLRTLDAAFRRVRSGVRAEIRLRSGQTHVFSDPDGADRTIAPTPINLSGMTMISLEKWDAGANPTVQLDAYVASSDGTCHLANYLRVYGALHLSFYEVNLTLPVKPGAGAIFQASRALVRSQYGRGAAVVDLGLGQQTTTVHPDGFTVVAGLSTARVTANVFTTTVAGGGRLISGGDQTAVIAAVASATFSGGSKIADAGTVGVNVLTNNAGVTV